MGPLARGTNHIDREAIRSGKTPGKSLRQNLRVGNTLGQGVRTMYSATLDGLKTEAENKKINNLTHIDIILIIITISLVIHILNLIARVNLFVSSMKSGLTRLERSLNENMKAIQA